MMPVQSTRPPFIIPHFTRSIVARSLAAWAFMRALATIAMSAAWAALGLRLDNPLRLNPVAALLVIALVAGLGWVSTRRRNEDTFLLCLGYSRSRQMAMFVGPAVVAELVITIVL
ncbi:MAG TPA: hypothetical protein VFS20_33920 [Longimicrobium sp.]|nr:hypothetical protein [Longimicrobium sp.]